MNRIHKKLQSSLGYWSGIALMMCLGTYFLLSSGCSSDFTKKLEAVPTAIGVPNQITVIADKSVWDGPLGDSLRYYFSSAYPILPQPEPIFDLRHFTAEQVNSEPIRRGRRTYLVFGNLSDQNSATAELIKTDLGASNVERAKRDLNYNTTIARDKWAKSQTIIYLFGNSGDELVNTIKENFSAIASRVNASDLPAIDASVYLGKENIKLINEVRNTFGVYLKVPGDYFLAVNDDETIWMRKENEYLSSNIMIHKIPYTDKSQFSKKGIKEIRDKLGRKYISSEVEASFMRTNDVDLPMLAEVVDLNGNYAMEARGIWDIVNDYMGGPFISYLILSPDSKELILIDGFVHAPGKKKRKFMQHLEYILSSFQFEKTE